MCCFQVQALLSTGSEPQVLHLPEEAGLADLSGPCPLWSSGIWNVGHGFRVSQVQGNGDFLGKRPWAHAAGRTILSYKRWVDFLFCNWTREPAFGPQTPRPTRMIAQPSLPSTLPLGLLFPSPIFLGHWSSDVILLLILKFTWKCR